jgi:prevent-host-death family protein
LLRGLESARSGEEVVTMRTISHRELRNNSSEILRDVPAGEIIEVTNNGEVSAVLVPPSFTPYERLLATGKARLPVDSSIDLRRIPRVRSSLRTADIIADVRGDR